MKLIRLKLENFRQHVDSTVDFGDGMTAIVGANGTGKSTILEGISFVLFGDVRANVADLKFLWATGSKYSATLRFQFDGKEYEAVRNQADAALVEIQESGTLEVAKSKRDVTKACEKLLRLNAKQFKNSFCAEQKNLSFLNFPTAEDRRREIGRMLGFDRLRAASTLAAERRKSMKERADELERLTGDPATWELAVEEAKNDHKAAVATTQSAGGLAAAARNELDAHRESAAKAERYRELSDRMEGIGKNAETLKTSVKTAEGVLAMAKAESDERTVLMPNEVAYAESVRRSAGLDQQRELEQNRSFKVAELEKLTGECESLSGEIADLVKGGADPTATDPEGAKRAVDSLETELRARQTRWQSARDSAHRAFAERQAASGEADKSRARIENLVKAGKCPECGSEIPSDGGTALKDAQRRADDALSALKQAKLALAAADAPSSDVAGIDIELASAKSALDKASSASRDSIALGIKQSALKAKREEAEGIKRYLEANPTSYDAAEHARVRTAVAEGEPAHRRFLALADAPARLERANNAESEARKAYDAAKLEFQDLKSERSALGFEDRAGADAVLTERHRLTAQDADLAARASASSEFETQARKMLDKVEADLKSFRIRQAELIDYRAQEALHDQAAKQMRALLESLNKQIRPQLVARASENLGILTNGRYQALELNDAYEASVVDEGTPKRVISGGEEDVVALSLRLALSELIQERQGRPMSLLILDEVFGGLDADRRLSVLDRLTALKDRFTQILIISHIEEINQVADQCLYLSRDASTRATVVTDAPPGDALSPM